jgi:hypothetical protein
VLDISAAAIEQARERLGARASAVEWYISDVCAFSPPHPYTLWHDRAVFHFLTDRSARRGYVQALERTVPPGGQVIIATFAPSGPPKCSGLEVVRYDAPALAAELGPRLRLVETRAEAHTTPAGAEQAFTWCRFQMQETT